MTGEVVTEVTEVDVDRIISSGSLEDIDKLLTQMGHPDDAPVVESGDTTAATPAEPAPIQNEVVPQAATPAATPAPVVVEDPPVVLAKDGKNQIPYSVLEQERQQNAAQKAQLDTQARELELLRQQLTDADIKPKDLPENVQFTPEQIEELKSYGEMGEAFAIQQAQIEWLKAQISSVATAAAPPPAAPVETNPFALNADTVRWAESDAHWGTVVGVNSALDADPAWMGKSPAERIPEIVRRTKLALGESSDADINAAAATALAAAQRVAPNSLTDVGGEVLGQTKSVAEQLEEGTQLDVEQFLAKQIAAGKSVDDVLNGLLG